MIKKPTLNLHDSFNFNSQIFLPTHFANLKSRTHIPGTLSLTDMIFNILQMFPKTPGPTQQDACVLMNKC